MTLAEKSATDNAATLKNDFFIGNNPFYMETESVAGRPNRSLTITHSTISNSFVSNKFTLTFS